MSKLQDTLNISSQMVVKLISIPFSLFAVGLATRRLSASDTYLLLAAQNSLILFGLLQLGLGAFILRRVSHDWARDHAMRSAPDVRGAFALIICAVSISLVAVAIAVQRGSVHPSMGALLIICVVSLAGQVADQVRLAIGELFKTNLFLGATYVICAVLLALALWEERPILWLLFVAAFAPQFIASIMSFAAMITRADFRELIWPRAPFDFPGALRESVPLLLGSGGTALLLSLPLAGHVLPGFPVIETASLACLRLFTSGLTLCYFALQPLTPILLRHRYRDPAKFRARAIAFLSVLVAGSVASGLVFSLAGPAFIGLWLGSVEVSSSLAMVWGVICALWLLLTTMAYFGQATSRPVLAAACPYLACAATVGAAFVMPGAPVEAVLSVGLLAGAGLAGAGAILAITDTVGPPAPPERRSGVG
ncbi:MAG: hypothetical protein ACK4JY_00165 [Brevundimonas sp.]|uniref:hypothetical protein n=1 Tax=Brevundimonas sp. TaxID=1871086 RepID=UPI003918A2FF